MIENDLRFAAKMQGIKYNPITGEQPGLIYHEYDTELNGGLELKENPGHTTEYNSSDATALFLISHSEYLRMTGDINLAVEQRSNIEAASNYIINHLDSDKVFVESPKFAGADSYALKTTHWKDSGGLPGREGGKPVYPVIYPLVHMENMAGLRAAAQLLGSKELAEEANGMKKAIPLIFDREIGNFPRAIDSLGEVRAIDSDGLTSLYFVDPGDYSSGMLKGIIKSSEVLETDLGYRTLEPKAAEQVQDKYHAETVWTHEQALMHAGASKLLAFAKTEGDLDLVRGLNHVLEVTGRMGNYLLSNPGSYPELFEIKGGELVPGKNNPQLWAVGAYNYFSAIRRSEETQTMAQAV